MKTCLFFLTIVLFPCLGLTQALDSRDVVQEEGVFKKASRDRIREVPRTELNRSSVFSKDIQMGRWDVDGDGCSSSTTSATVSPDLKTLSVLFDDFGVQLSGGRPGRQARNCMLRIPFRVPVGFQATVVAMDYRGFSSLPKKSNVDLIVGMQMGKQERVRNHRYSFQGPLDEEFLVQALTNQKPVWYECGKDFNLMINTRIVAFNNHSQETLIFSIDSLDVQATYRAYYHLLWQKCRVPENKPILR